MLRTAAYNKESFSSNAFSKHLFLADAAPSINLSMSAPLTAIGSKPTAVRTEKRPPTSSGTTKLSYPSSVARFFNAPLALSVVA